METSNREIKTVMHTVKLRRLTVKKIEQVVPHIRRITLTGEDLADFVSLSPDDHVKVFFPYPGEQEAIIPTMGPQGMQVPEGSRKPIMRDYTPRRFDPAAKELDLEFFLHGEGPGSQWALQAQVGQTLAVGGPRGSKVVPYAFDWYLMVGDEAALPSFARRLLELPQGVKAIVIAEVENASEQVQFQSSAQVEVHWVHRQGSAKGSSDLLKNELVKLSVPSGDYFAWLAGEKACVKELQEVLVTIKGAKEEWIKATGYWQRGGGH